ncbi:MAG: hypothetical protein RLZ12_36 [Bacillota bacterium]
MQLLKKEILAVRSLLLVLLVASFTGVILHLLNGWAHNELLNELVTILVGIPVNLAIINVFVLKSIYVERNNYLWLGNLRSSFTLIFLKLVVCTTLSSVFMLFELLLGKARYGLGYVFFILFLGSFWLLIYAIYMSLRNSLGKIVFYSVLLGVFVLSIAFYFMPLILLSSGIYNFLFRYLKDYVSDLVLVAKYHVLLIDIGRTVYLLLWTGLLFLMSCYLFNKRAEVV